ncbi:SCO4225 family membrane protein [Streptomyces sp. NPDC060002]|uniref:SCO4225 family membrane protein n=1 Tax=Streptomyces sp. NPDC060002 TaxID=3347033 RepID=UPI0036CBFF3F
MTGTGSGRTFPRRLRHRLRRGLGHALGDVFARVYLALCAVLLVWATVVTVGDSSDESMAGVIPLLATAPASFVLIVLPDGVTMFVVAVVFGALVNATVIGWCARALRRGERPDPTL